MLLAQLWIFVLNLGCAWISWSKILTIECLLTLTYHFVLLENENYSRESVLYLLELALDDLQENTTRSGLFYVLFEVRGLSARFASRLRVLNGNNLAKNAIHAKQIFVSYPNVLGEQVSFMLEAMNLLQIWTMAGLMLSLAISRFRVHPGQF